MATNPATKSRQRVAVITGASAGIGLAAAKALAAQGWRIIGTGRDPQRTAAAAQQIQAVAMPGVRVDMIRVDLALVAEAARAADRIAALTEHIDALLNNAGGAAKQREITSEGNEATFASNHLGHFVLTNRLLPLLRAAAASSPRGATRIVNVSSAAHEVARGLDWDDLQMLQNFVPIAAYCNVKLANILFTRELAERLAADGIIAHAMHPGAVDTNFIDRADAGTQAYMRSRTDLLTPEAAADTLVWLATAPEAGDTTGAYFHQRKAIQASAAAYDAAAAHRLWRESEKLVAAVRTSSR